MLFLSSEINTCCKSNIKIIVCNGGYRTGSTLSFNICLKIAKLTGIYGNNFNSIGASHNTITSLSNQQFLSNGWFIKSHDFVPNEVLSHVRIIHTYRNPLAVAASLYRIKRIKPNYIYNNIIKLLLKQKEMQLYHNDRRDTLVVPYDLLYNQIDKSVELIASHIGAIITKRQINIIRDELSIEKVKKICEKIPERGADSYTQFRHNHISEQNGNDNYWKDNIPQELVNKIKKEVGYYLGFS